MDWLSIVIAVLVFVLPAIFENDKKKKRRRDHLPHPVEEPDLMEKPLPVEPVEEVQSVSSVPDKVQVPGPVAEPVRVQPAPDPGMAVPAEQTSVQERTPGRRRRFNARDMVIYSEIMHPKYLDD